MSYRIHPEARIHLTTRDGFKKTVIHPSNGVEGARDFNVPRRLDSSVVAGLSEYVPGPSSTYARQTFELVKTAVITDHRTGEQRLEKWFEER